MIDCARAGTGARTERKRNAVPATRASNSGHFIRLASLNAADSLKHCPAARDRRSRPNPRQWRNTMILSSFPVSTPFTQGLTTALQFEAPLPPALPGFAGCLGHGFGLGGWLLHF